MNQSSIVLGGGCFWCLEAVYQRVQGVLKVESGYAGGSTDNPSYESVSSGTTGHAEVVRITFDQSIISLEQVLDIFWEIHDPTTLNRQGNDEGTQYRSIIFYTNLSEQHTIQESIEKLKTRTQYVDPIVTEVMPLDAFYRAEDYHQDYYNQHRNQPYCRIVIDPKVRKLMDRRQH